MPLSPSEIERKTLRLSVIIVAIAALWSSAMAVYTRSMAVAMDAAFNVLSAFLTGMGAIVVRFMEKGFTKRHPLGFYPYEALIAVVRSLFLAGMLAVLFIDALNVIFGGGKEVPLNAMLIYTFPSLIFCTAGFLVCLGGYQKTKTMTLEADLNEWRSSFFIAIAVFCSIVGAFFLKKSPWAFLTPYVDPALVIFLCLVFIKEPLFLLRDAFKHLMLQSADPEFSRPFRKTLIAMAEERYPKLRLNLIEVIRVGRTSWVLVEIKPETTDLSLKQYHSLDRDIKEMSRKYFKDADTFLYFAPGDEA